MTAYLYCITNLITGKKYIGVTIDPDRRKSEHFSKSVKGSILVQRSIEKYGKENLIFEIMLSGKDTDMYLLESKYIAENNTLSPNGYNIAEGGQGGKTGPINEETKKKMSIAHTGKSRYPHTTETKQKMSNAAIGRKASKETKENMSKNRKGSGNAMFGKEHPNKGGSSTNKGKKKGQTWEEIYGIEGAAQRRKDAEIRRLSKKKGSSI